MHTGDHKAEHYHLFGKMGVKKYNYELCKENFEKIYTYGEHSEKIECGNRILFGEYPFEANGDKKPIEWIVMRIDENSNLMFLVSRYVIDVMPYGTSNKKISWNNSDLRKWLNGDFINNSFSIEEQEKIIPTRIPYTEYKRYTWKSLNQPGICMDKVFLLSFKDMWQYWAIYSEANRFFGFKDSDNISVTPLAPYIVRTADLTPFAKTKDFIASDSLGWNWNEITGVQNYFLRDNLENEIGCVVIPDDKKFADPAKKRSEGVPFFSHSNKIPDGVRPAMWVAL